MRQDGQTDFPGRPLPCAVHPTALAAGTFHDALVGHAPVPASCAGVVHVCTHSRSGESQALTLGMLGHARDVGAVFRRIGETA